MTSNNPTTQLHQQADAFLNGGLRLEARHLYKQICALHKNDAKAWLMISTIDGNSGKIDDAISYIKGLSLSTPVMWMPTMLWRAC